MTTVAPEMLSAEAAARTAYALVRAAVYQAKLEQLCGCRSAKVRFQHDQFVAVLDTLMEGAYEFCWPFDAYPALDTWKSVQLVRATVYAD